MRHLLRVLVVDVTFTAAHGSLGLLGLRGATEIIGAVETKLGLHLGDLGHGELGELLGNAEGPLLLYVSLREDDVDFLEVTAGGLNVEEPGERNGDEVDKCEEQVDTPVGLVGEHGSEHDDGEVGDPVHAGRGGGGLGTGAEGVDFGGVDPGERQRSKGEEADEQEDTNNGTLGVLRVGVDQAAHGDNETETLAEETNQEQVAATNLLNHEEGGDGSESVDGSEDTTQNKGELASHLQVLLEKESGVVDSGVATSELLEKLARATDHHTLEVLGLATGEEDLPVAGLDTLKRLEIGLHEVVIGENVLGVDSAIVESSQDLEGLLVMTLHDEPTRRLRKGESTQCNKDGEEDLEGDGETPLHGAFDVRETEIDPVGNECSDGNNGTLEANEKTTVVCTGTLRLPDRNSSGVHAVSKTGNDTSNHELAQTPVRAKCSSGDNSTENHQETTGHQERSTSDLLTVHKSEDSTEETTKLVTGGDGTTQNGDMFGVTVERRELLGKLGTGNDTGHQALIITEERETNDGCEGDGKMELLAPQAEG
jgi:hypothetical protein